MNTITSDHPLLQTLFGGSKEDIIKVPLSNKSIAIIPAPKYYEGNPQVCGKADCKECPAQFVFDIYSGVPRFLCAKHLQRWTEKREYVNAGCFMFDIVFIKEENKYVLK